MNIALEPYVEEIQILCKQHNVSSLYLFGSATQKNFNEDSDVDFLVKFKSINLINYFSNYMSFKNKLNKLLNRNIDLLEEQTLKNPILIKSINKNKELIYG